MMFDYSNLNKIKKGLEITYGVQISDTSLLLAMENEENNFPISMFEKACEKLKERLVGRDEFHFDRAFIELKELRKEKPPSRLTYLSRLEKEYTEMRIKLDVVVRKWAPVLDKVAQHNEKRTQLLEKLHECLVKLDLSAMGGVVDEFWQTVHDNFKKCLSITPELIGEIIPCPPKVHLPFDGLECKLSNEFIGLDDIINVLVGALKTKEISLGPVGSFLLLAQRGHGRTQLGISLARHIFGDDSRFRQIDLLEYSDPYSLTRIVDFLSEKQNSVCQTVVMFRNLEEAHVSVIDALLNVLEHGQMIDSRGIVVDFTRSLVLISSNVGHDDFRFCSCRKYVFKLSMKNILEGSIQWQNEEHKERCEFMPYIEKVNEKLNELKPGFIRLLDDVIVFPSMSAGQYMSIIRLQLRDVAASISNKLLKPVIVYPSENAVTSLYCKMINDMIYHEGYASKHRVGHARKLWLPDLFETVLYEIASENQDSDMVIIYIDLLLGSCEFSYRYGSGRQFVNDLSHKKFKELHKRLRIMYTNEMNLVMDILRMRAICAHDLKFLDPNARQDCSIPSTSHEQLDFAMRLCKNISDHASELNIVEPDSFNCEVDLFLEKKAGENEVGEIMKGSGDGSCAKLAFELDGCDQATKVVAGALLRSANVGRPFSFLCIGLRDLDKAAFVKNISQCLVGDNGTKLTLEVDSSQCIDGLLFAQSICSGRDGTCLLTEVLPKNQSSVIVFNNLEEVHNSTLNTLLSVLDNNGVLCDDGKGNVIDFRQSVLLFISKAGNKDMIGRLTGSGFGDIPHSEQKSIATMRGEVVNRIDEIMMFNPFFEEQLKHVSRLSMEKLVYHQTSRGGIFGIQNSLFELFNIDCSKMERVDMYKAFKQLSPAIIGA